MEWTVGLDSSGADNKLDFYIIFAPSLFPIPSGISGGDGNHFENVSEPKK